MFFIIFPDEKGDKSNHQNHCQNTNKAVIKPIPKRKQKYKIVISHPISINEYLTSKGDTKKPNDPAQVTMPVAIVLLDDGKCFATTETGMLIAVPPNPIPIRSPIVNVKR